LLSNHQFKTTEPDNNEISTNWIYKPKLKETDIKFSTGKKISIKKVNEW
jgi:hypothetical protein